MIPRGSSTVACILTLVSSLALVTAAEEPAPKLTEPDRWNARAPDSYRARFECSNGTFVIEVTRSLAARGADRFYNLVQSGFFDGVRFFRVMPDFIVQFGLNGNPAANQAWFRSRLRDDQVNGSNTLGTISFATSGPHARTTQVFVNLADNATLDAQGFSPFGRVVEGLDVVTEINAQYGQKPSQGLIRSEGNSYLQREFPELDFVQKATIVDAAPSTRQAPPSR